jgi:tetratricopeptide (TPR) repeat protein
MAVGRGREWRPAAGRPMVRGMAAAAVAHDYELPPYTIGGAVLSDVSAGVEAESAVAAAERLVAENRHDDAVARLADVWPETRSEPRLAFRHRLVLSWAEMYLGRLDRARELLQLADAIVVSPRFDAADRAEVVFRHGCLALKRSDVGEAASLFTRALETNDASPLPSARLEARAREWRARCYVLQRDWEPARRDVERSLEAAAAAGDALLQAHGLFQAAIVAERQRQWLLARCYAEQALAVYVERRNELGVARTLNNLGCLHFLLGDVETAEQTLAQAAEQATKAGSDADVAQASSSLAQVYLRTGRPDEARVRAEDAVELLSGRTDFLDELGNAQLVVARAHAACGDHDGASAWLDRAESSFTSLGSASHLSAAWTARGDLAREHGDVEAAAELYRRAAEHLQDFHF